MQKKARDANRSGEIIKKDAELVPSRLTIKKKEKLGGINIAEADVIVSGGRGLKKAEDFGILAALAELFGGCSRIQQAVGR